MTPAVSDDSTTPATVRWASAIAGIVCARWNGAYSGVPSARVEQRRLEAELDRGAQRGGVEADVAADARPRAPAAGESARRLRVSSR